MYRKIIYRFSLLPFCVCVPAGPCVCFCFCFCGCCGLVWGGGAFELITVCICRLNKEASPSPVCSLVSGRSSWIDGLWCEKFTFRRYFSINCRSCSIPRRRSLPSFFLLFSLLLYVLQLYVVCHRFRSYAVVCDVLFLCFFPRSFGVCVK